MKRRIISIVVAVGVIAMMMTACSNSESGEVSKNFLENILDGNDFDVKETTENSEKL